MSYGRALAYGALVVVLIFLIAYAVMYSARERFNTQSACHDWPTRRDLPVGLTCSGCDGSPALGYAAYARPTVPWAYAPYDQVANTGTHPGVRLRA